MLFASSRETVGILEGAPVACCYLFESFDLHIKRSTGSHTFVFQIEIILGQYVSIQLLILENSATSTLQIYVNTYIHNYTYILCRSKFSGGHSQLVLRDFRYWKLSPGIRRGMKLQSIYGTDGQYLDKTE